MQGAYVEQRKQLLDSREPIITARVRSWRALHPQEDQAQDGHRIIASDYHRTTVVLRQALAEEQTEQCDERKYQPPERQPRATPYQ